MAAERHGIASWPGVVSVYSASGTLSHSISPGTINLVTLPQATPPAETGTLVIGDGFEAVTLVDCKVSQLTVERKEKGFVWSLAILDRRWKWRGLGAIGGEYNQLDEHGKLVPWTIRSPTELAVLCLLAMGETNYAIDLPAGLDSSVGALAYQLNPPWIGVTPTTGTNPCVNWTYTPPAQALSELCERFGRRIVPRWSDGKILIVVAGTGGDLPDGSIAQLSPSIKAPETPSGVTVIGSPTIYQDWLAIEPVGIDWDGSYRPIDQLTYAPLAVPPHSRTDPPPVPGSRWNGADVPTFTCALATDRLTKREAMTLAAKSVFRCYRIYDPITVHGYGPIARRQQIVLRGTRAEQITPQPGDDQVQDRSGNPITLNFYNGYSRDKPAICYGSVVSFLTGPFFIPQGTVNSQSPPPNTNRKPPLYEPFSVDPVNQVITFGRPVYKWDQALGAIAPDLSLETGFFIRNAGTNQLETFSASQALPGMSGLTNYLVRKYDDIQFNVITTYDDAGNASTTLLEDDPIKRSSYYLTGMASQFFQTAGLTLVYNGIRAIDLDGAITQITWDIGPGGAKTTASRNTEHSIYVPPYPARRRAEFLAAGAPRTEQQRVMVAEQARGRGATIIDAILAILRGL